MERTRPSINILLKKVINIISNQEFEKNFSKIIFLLFSVGVILRITKLFSMDMSIDEALTIVRSIEHSVREHLIRDHNYLEHTHPPLFYILMKIIHLGANDLYSIRLINLISSIIALKYFYKWTNLVFSDENKMIIYTYFSTSLFLIYFSVVARTYAISIMFLSMFLYYTVLLFREKKDSISIAITAFLAIAFDYSAFWPIFIATALMLRHGIRLKNLKKLMFSYYFLILWGLNSIIPHFMKIVAIKSNSGLKGNSIIDQIFVFSAYYSFKIFQNFNFVIIFSGITIILFLLSFFKKRSDNKFWNEFLIISSIIPITLFTVVSMSYKNIYDYKHLYFSYISIAILILVSIPQKLKYITIIILILYSVKFVNYYENVEDRSLISTSKFISENIIKNGGTYIVKDSELEPMLKAYAYVKNTQIIFTNENSPQNYNSEIIYIGKVHELMMCQNKVHIIHDYYYCSLSAL